MYGDQSGEFVCESWGLKGVDPVSFAAVEKTIEAVVSRLTMSSIC